MEYLSLINRNIVISTNIVAKYLNIEHKNILKTINNNKNDFLFFGEMLEGKEKTKGRSFEVKYLNEEQFIFYITLSKNKKETVYFKKIITQEFFKMRKWILEQKAQKLNEQYIETRNQSKIGRKQETDIIKIFTEYSKNQGSKNADKYYMLFSKMENAAFFILKEKFKNVREILNIQQLSKIIIADIIIRQAIIEGMDKQMFYRDIFQEAKKRVIELSNSLGFKEIIPSCEFKQISMLED